MLGLPREEWTSGCACPARLSAMALCMTAARTKGEEGPAKFSLPAGEQRPRPRRPIYMYTGDGPGLQK
jgi:hypothetical protein